MESWPVHPYRTATALLIGCSLDLSLRDVTSKLQLLIQHIEEVLSVTVEGQENALNGPVLPSLGTEMSCLRSSDSSSRERGVQGES